MAVTLSIRNVPTEVAEALRRRAARHHRSLQGELMALLHDAPEYVVGDMISPFKAALGLDYKAFEKRLLSAIHMRFSLPPKTPTVCETEIKTADKMAAYLEATQLAGFSVPEAEKFFGRPKGLSGEGSRKFLQLKPLPPNDAAALFLKKFKLLVQS